MNEQDLRDLLREAPLPADDRERALEVVRRAFAEREPVRRPRRRHARALVLAAATAALVAAALSPPGRAVLDDVREAIGIERTQPALFSLPAPGRLLVTSSAGSWVVSEDGSTRLLGAYLEASWSPFGRFVVAARANEIDALDPSGRVRWKLARPSVRFPRWVGTPQDTRIAYLSRNRLRVVAGDGTDDRLVASDVDPVAPAWRPESPFVVVFARRGTVVALEADTGRRLWQRRVGTARALSWSPTGELLLVRGDRSLIVLDARGRTRFDLLRPELSAPIEAAALAPNGQTVAFVQRAGAQSHLWLISALRPDGSRAQRVFSGRGAFTGLEWSPDGRWLLVAWREANQWLFFRSAGVRAVHGVSGISAQFDGGFPVLGGWCCGTG
jgi:putative pyrroloquinoline-quinone binding quinoprotein